jgi:cysteine-rich CPCC protein
MAAEDDPSADELARRRRWFDGYCQQLDENSVQRGAEPGRGAACPCCHHFTLGERGEFEICPVCFWEDDGQDDHDADHIRGGPNGMLSLTEARRNYVAFGACDERSKEFVRAPLPEEKVSAG